MSSSDFGAGQPRLHAVAASEVTRIRITDSDFQPVLLPENAGQVDVALAPGIYEVAFVDAEVTERQLVVLRSGAGTPVEVTQSPHVVGTPGPTSGGAQPRWRSTSRIRGHREACRGRPVPRRRAT